MRGILTLFTGALLLVGALSAPQANAATVASDSYFTVKWTLNSAGNNCSGYPAKVARIYTGSTSGPTPTPDPSACCPTAGDPNACTFVGGWKSGYPDSGACSGYTPPITTYDIGVYKNGGSYSPDYSGSNGSASGYSVFANAGTDVSMIRLVVGFNNNQPASCPGLSGGYCYTGHVHDLTNFSTSLADCGVWKQNTVSDCAFSSADVWVKFEPTTGCPGTPTPTPVPATPTPASTCGGTLPSGSATGGAGSLCNDAALCPTCAGIQHQVMFDNLCQVGFQCMGMGTAPGNIYGGTGTCQSCGGSVLPTATPLPTLPPSTPTPTPTPDPNACKVQGGTGRQCDLDTDCTCAGYRCRVVGNQPLKLHTTCASGDSSCVVGVEWVDGWSSLDDILGGPVTGASVKRFTGPTKMCVDPAHDHADGDYQHLLPPAAVASADVDNSLITWDGFFFACNLQMNDKHRHKVAGANVGCRCETNYAPLVMSTSDYGAITYNIHLGNPVLESLWADVVFALDHHEELKRTVAQASDKLSDLIPEANAGPGGCTLNTSTCVASPTTCAGACAVVYDATSGDCVSTKCLGGAGTATFSFTPNSYDFGAVVASIQTTPTQSIVIKNTSATQSASDCVVSVSDPTDFLLGSTAGCSNMAAGASCTVTLAGKPGSVGAHSATLNIICDGLAANSKFDIDHLFAQLKKTVHANSDRVYDALVPTAGACSAPLSGVGCQGTLDCPSDPAYTGTISGCCCSYTWSDCGYISKDACVCSQYPNSAGCTGGGTGGTGSGTSGTYTVTGNPASGCSISVVCSSLTCPGGKNLVLLEYAQDLGPFGGTSGGSGMSSPPGGGTCAQENLGKPGYMSSLYAMCATSAPTTSDGFTACTDNSSITYYTQTSGGGCGTNLLACSGATPTPSGGVTPTPVPTAPPVPTATPATRSIYVDQGRTWGGTAYPYTVASQGYGTLVSTVTGSQVIGCARNCPDGGIHPGNNPNDCTCTTPGTAFDVGTWTCISCPSGSIVTNGKCQCPYNWEPVGGKCRPRIPSGEFVRNDTNDNFPICTSGTGPQNARIPVTYGLSSSDASSVDYPRNNDSYSIGTQSYPYSSEQINGSTKYPGYFYANLPHCACSGQVRGSSPPQSGVPATVSGAFKGDTLDYVSSFASSGLPNKDYGMVAMALNGTSDGRAGATFTSCGCPNVNEYPALVDPSDSRKGVVCKSVIPATDLNRVFTTFDPIADDGGTTQVYTRALVNLSQGIAGGYTEPLNGTKLVTTINLPTSQSAPNALASYARHIWKCQIGYELDMTANPPNCKWTDAKHKCDATSPMDNNSDAAKTLGLFATTVNKKLACCMNNRNSALTKSSTDVKFDCIDSNVKNTGDFEALWSSADDEADGGEINGLILSSSGMNMPGATGGKPITGFYTLEGSRCSEYSEFDSAGIQPGIVNPSGANSANQQNLANGATGEQFKAAGTRIMPALGSTGYTQLKAGFTSFGKSMVAPQPATGNAAENAKARRCPILVRAALVASCPAISTGQNAVKYTYQDASGKKRCPSAETIQVHIRAEQVFEIAGQPKMITVDTVVDRKNASSVSLEQIIRKKNGANCLPGMTSGAGGCHY